MKNICLCLALFSLGFLLTQCTNNPEYSEIPQIEFVGFSKNTLLQGQQQEDSIFVTINFEDGDGDIGSETNQVDIFIKDSRVETAIPLSYAIPSLSELGSENGISGTMRIKLFSTCCFQGSVSCQAFEGMPTQDLSYEIYITDNAGNESNRITTDVVQLICD